MSQSPSVSKTVAPLRVARVAAGLTQPQLARRVGSTQTRISRIEKGMILPTRELARKIARAVGCRINHLWPALASRSARSKSDRQQAVA